MKVPDEINFSEIKLDQYIQNIKKDDIFVPDELELRIQERISSLKRPVPIFRYVIAALVAICIMTAAMVRFNPVIASYASEIPGFASAVAWLRGDSGIRNAHEHGYGGIDNMIIEQDGFKLEITDTYFDEDRLRFSSIVSGSEIVSMLQTKQRDGRSDLINDDIHLEFDFKDFNNKGYVMKSYGQNNEFLAFEVEKSFEPRDAVTFTEKSPSALNIGIKIKKGNVDVYNFGNIKLPFDVSKFMMSNVYKQNKCIVMKHTEINIDNLVISLTRMKLYTRFKMDNGYFFTNFENPYLMDEKGNIYKPEGIIGSDSGPNEKILYFVPSTYFNKQPVKLYFCFDGIRIGSEEEKSFTLNLEEKFPKKLLYMGEEITITKAAFNETGKLTVEFEYPGDGTIRIQGLSVMDNGLRKTGVWISSMWPSDTPSDNSISKNTCEFEIEKRPIYNMELDYPGYLIPSGMNVEMKLQK